MGQITMKRNINFYDKIYFSFLCAIKKLGGPDAQFSAGVAISVFFSVSVLRLLIFYFTQDQLRWLNSRLVIALFVVPMIGLNYLYFVYKSRFEFIKEKLEFDNEVTRNKYSKVGFILGLAFTVIFFSIL
jgi:hypothetical protein